MSSIQTLHVKTCLFADEHSAICQIREAVFQQEQGIAAELDWDGLDDSAIHVLVQVRLEGQGSYESVGGLRLREIAGEAGSQSSVLKLERLAILNPYRHQGLGSELVYTAIAYAQDQGYDYLVLHAQTISQSFYEPLGFEPVGEPFVEAGISHIKMEQRL
jgi:predicted GNAT family N-acyltransferase